MNIRTIKDIRCSNLRLLITHFAKGRQNIFAEKVDAAATNISQVLNKKAPNGMGDKLARKIELAYDLPVGWMDVYRESVDIASEPALRVSYEKEKASSITGTDLQRIVSIYSTLSPSFRKQWLVIGDILINLNSLANLEPPEIGENNQKMAS